MKLINAFLIAGVLGNVMGESPLTSNPQLNGNQNIRLDSIEKMRYNYSSKMVDQDIKGSSEEKLIVYKNGIYENCDYE